MRTACRYQSTSAPYLALQTAIVTRRSDAPSGSRCSRGASRLTLGRRQLLFPPLLAPGLGISVMWWRGEAGLAGYAQRLPGERCYASARRHTAVEAAPVVVRCCTAVLLSHVTGGAWLYHTTRLLAPQLSSQRLSAPRRRGATLDGTHRAEYRPSYLVAAKSPGTVGCVPFSQLYVRPPRRRGTLKTARSLCRASQSHPLPRGPRRLTQPPMV